MISKKPDYTHYQNSAAHLISHSHVEGDQARSYCKDTSNSPIINKQTPQNKKYQTPQTPSPQNPKQTRHYQYPMKASKLIIGVVVIPIYSSLIQGHQFRMFSCERSRGNWFVLISGVRYCVGVFDCRVLRYCWFFVSLFI